MTIEARRPISQVDITGSMSIITQFLLSLKATETNVLCKQTSLFSLHEEVNFHLSKLLKCIKDGFSRQQWAVSSCKSSGNMLSLHLKKKRSSLSHHHKTSKNLFCNRDSQVQWKIKIQFHPEVLLNLFVCMF